MLNLRMFDYVPNVNKKDRCKCRPTTLRQKKKKQCKTIASRNIINKYVNNYNK